jgi:amino acid adenylation domain-containing protein
MKGTERPVCLGTAGPQPVADGRPAAGVSVVPASLVQRQFWLLQQLAPDSPAYHMVHAFRLRGRLEAAALTGSLEQIVARHEAFRTTFTVRGEQLLQVIAPSGPLALTTVDLSGDAAVSSSPHGPGAEATVAHLVAAEATRPFDLSRGPLLRVLLLRRAPEEHVLVVTMHHIITDLQASQQFLDELSGLYEATTTSPSDPLPSSGPQYADYARWEQSWLATEEFGSMLGYWEQQLRGQAGLLSLPTDRPRPAVPSFAGAQVPVELSGTILEVLQRSSRQAGLPLFVTLLSAYAVLLHRYTRQSSLLVGVPFTNRRRREFQEVMGCLVNILPVAIDLSGEPSFRELLQRVRQTMLEAHRRQEVTLERIVERLKLSRDLSHNPLYQVGFTFSPAVQLQLSGVAVEALGVPTGAAQLDLFLLLWESQGAVRGWIEYRTDLFEHATVERFAGHYGTLLASIAQDLDRPIASLEILSEAQKEQMLVQWNDTQVDYPRDRCIHQWFEAQAQRTPDAVALVFEDQQLTYRELNERANRLAHLLQANGVGPEVPVGVAVERSVEMVVGLYGILKAGGAYMPLDPTYPPERIAYMLQEAGVSLLLTQASLSHRLPVWDGQAIDLDRQWQDLVAHQSAENPVGGMQLENLAYIIYTSGSTGQPKGVMNTHGGILNRLLWMQDIYRLTGADRILQKTPFSFDVSVWEFFWPLMFGARLVVARPEGHRDSNYLIRTIVNQQITVMHFVPSMLRLFLEAPRVEECRSLRHVICSGEALTADLQNRFFARLAARLHNLYGPTEAAVDVTYWECRRAGETMTVPIGRPVANTQIYILDDQLGPVPIGVPGELHIGGVQVARGYVNRPDLTAEKFIPDLFRPGPAARLYKTGDLAGYQPDGNIVYLGRLDHQVKIRGLRVELGEIESALTGHALVREAAVLAWEDIPGDKRLIAYVVPREPSPPDASELRDYLRRRLPEYMVPAGFAWLEALPLTPTGKVDRRRLPVPDRPCGAARAYLPPRTELEQRLAGLWQTLLRVPAVSRHDNFFDLGGHSLLIMQVHQRLHEITDKEVSVADLFRFPTVASLAEYLGREAANDTAQVGIMTQRAAARTRTRQATLARRRQTEKKDNV